MPIRSHPAVHVISVKFDSVGLLPIALGSVPDEMKFRSQRMALKQSATRRLAGLAAEPKALVFGIANVRDRRERRRSHDGNGRG
jgi:hypothetical protein